MSKSIKLKNDTYWDSSSIVYGKKSLASILDELIPVVLFSNGSGVYELGTYDLTDDISHYTYLEVYVGRGADYGGQSVKFLRMFNGVTILLPYYDGNTRSYIKEFHLSFSGKTFTIDKLGNLSLSNGEAPILYPEESSYNRVYRILGYK